VFLAVAHRARGHRSECHFRLVVGGSVRCAWDDLLPGQRGPRGAARRGLRLRGRAWAVTGYGERKAAPIAVVDIGGKNGIVHAQKWCAVAWVASAAADMATSGRPDNRQKCPILGGTESASLMAPMMPPEGRAELAELVVDLGAKAHHLAGMLHPADVREGNDCGHDAGGRILQRSLGLNGSGLASTEQVGAVLIDDKVGPQ